MTQLRAASRRLRVLPVLALVGWAAVTFGVVLQWHVHPDVGDGDCGTIWSVLFEDRNAMGCDGRPAFVVGVVLTSGLFFGPFWLAWPVRRLGTSRRSASYGAGERRERR